MKRIPIAEARHIADRCNQRVVVIVCWEDEGSVRVVKKQVPKKAYAPSPSAFDGIDPALVKFQPSPTCTLEYGYDDGQDAVLYGYRGLQFGKTVRKSGQETFTPMDEAEWRANGKIDWSEEAPGAGCVVPPYIQEIIHQEDLKALACLDTKAPKPVKKPAKKKPAKKVVKAVASIPENPYSEYPCPSCGESKNGYENHYCRIIKPFHHVPALDVLPVVYCDHANEGSHGLCECPHDCYCRRGPDHKDGVGMCPAIRPPT